MAFFYITFLIAITVFLSVLCVITIMHTVQQQCAAVVCVAADSVYNASIRVFVENIVYTRSKDK